MKIITSIYHAPCSTIMLGSYDGRLCLCDWTGGWHSDSNYRRLFRMLGTTFEEGACDVNSKAAAQLDEYFGGVRRQFDLPLLNLRHTVPERGVDSPAACRLRFHHELRTSGCHDRP